MRRFALTIAAAGAVTITLLLGPLGTEAAPAPVFEKTIIGTDFHALDHRQAVQFVSDTGGGVYLYGEGSNGTSYMEANVDLPVGAKIKNVTIYYHDCGSDANAPLASFYFGSYSPSAGFAYDATSDGASTMCNNGTLVLTPTSDVRVVASQRYTVGTGTHGESGAITTSPRVLVRGARIRYSCPTKCLP